MAKSRSSSRRSRKPRSAGSRFVSFLKWMLVLGILAGLAGVAGLAGIFYYYGRDLPEILKREDYNPPQVSQVFAAGGELIAEFHTPGERRTLVPLDRIPPVVQNAFMAAEDAEFMTHSGVDYVGLVRAVYYALRYDQGMKGTSTITQQTIKNLMLTPERAYERKIKEMILARELEENLTKEDILYLYLNTIYLGHGTHGVEEASQHYFGKSVSDLNVQEAALLAGLTSGPEANTPFRNPEGAMRRRTYVLRQLWEKGFIEEGVYRDADKTEIEIVPRSTSRPHLGSAPYFVEHIRQDLMERYGEEKVYTGGLRIHTTLDLDMQLAAERAARQGLRAYDDRRKFFQAQRRLAEDDIPKHIARQHKEHSGTLRPTQVYEAVVTGVDVENDRVDVQLGQIKATLALTPRTRILGEGSEAKPLDEAFARGDVLRVQPLAEITPDHSDSAVVRFETSAEAALVAIDPLTREVKALVGGYDFGANKYNHAIQARRQTGSAFKTLVYAAALETRNITPATVYLDSPTVFKLPGGESWSPRNSDGKWRGPIRVREGLASSRNVVSVRVLNDVTLPRAIEFSKRVGVQSPIVNNYTMVMGSSEMPPIEITNTYATFAANGQLAQPRFLNRVESARGDRDLFQTHAEPVLAPEVAHLTTSLLQSAVDGYIDSKGNRRGGTAGLLRAVGHPIAAKTGTTNESRDAWIVGYIPDLVVGAWVGFGDNRSLGPRQYGGSVAGPIFRDFLIAALEDRKVPLEFQPPVTGVTTAQIDPITGKLARSADDGFEEVFMVGTAPTEYAPSNEEDSGENFLFEQFQ
ncbi:hypothetical protein DL240_12665 [Lujinxingia litoralis]|uniref:Uncharacterized protein n=1 Tax=Lujinxingia litoralis TaxID=2211119 RepID=A0A328C9Q2_9DELT|nr:PBP1A family penicillin-binding protein [Lujinxingia litoralis]RAL21700.1 hypothetical protein DL240_12665 [Lujinxingia litoralis]